MENTYTLLQLLFRIAADMRKPISYIPHGVLIGLLASALGFLVMRLWGRGKDKTGILCGLFLCGLYFTVLFEMTVLSREPGSRTGIDMGFLETWGQYAVPDAYFVENILMFIPFGVLMPIMIKTFRDLRCCLAVGMLFSIIIETVQLLTQRGHCQLDDVVTNAAGTVIGWCMYMVCKAGRRTYD